jgi:uncharacterized OB-fold protein
MRLEEIKAKYYESFNSEKLPFLLCKKCGHKFYYPRTRCPKCFSEDLEIMISKGFGKIYTMTRFPRLEGSPVFGIIEMDEGFKLYTNILGRNPDVGVKVRIIFLEKNGRKYPFAEVVI